MKKLLIVICVAGILIGLLIATQWGKLFPGTGRTVSEPRLPEFQVQVSAPAGVTTEIIIIRQGEEETATTDSGTWSKRVPFKARPGEDLAVRASARADAGEVRVQPLDPRPLREGEVYEFSVEVVTPPDTLVAPETLVNQPGPEIMPPPTVVRQYRVSVTSAGEPVAGAQLKVTPKDLAAPATTRSDGCADLTVRGRNGSEFRILVSQECRSKTSDGLRLAEGEPQEVPISLPAVLTLTYRVEVARKGDPAPVVGAEVEAGPCASRGSTGPDGTVSITANLPEGEELRFTTRHAKENARPVVRRHSSVAASAVVTLELPEAKTHKEPEPEPVKQTVETTKEPEAQPIKKDVPPPLQATYVFRASRDGKAQADVRVRITDPEGKPLGEKSTDRKGLARVDVVAPRGTLLTYGVSAPAALGSCKPVGKLEAAVEHRAKPDSIRLEWLTVDESDTGFAIVKTEIERALALGWNTAFLVMKCRPGEFGNRDACRRSPEVVGGTASLNECLNRLRVQGEENHRCPIELRAEITLARMLAAAARADVPGCESEYQRFRGYARGVSVPRESAALLYRALARTVAGATSPEALSEIEALLEAATRNMGSAEVYTKRRAEGKIFCVTAVAYWQAATSLDATNPTELLRQAQTNVEMWSNWCSGDPTCKDRPFIEQFRRLVEG